MTTGKRRGSASAALPSRDLGASGLAQKPLSAPEIDAAASSIRALLERIDTGDLVASTATQHRLEGALLALQAVLRPTDDLPKRLGWDGDEPG